MYMSDEIQDVHVRRNLEINANVNWTLHVI